MNHPGVTLRAVIFDLDGTLVDTADDFIPVVQALRAENRLPPMDPDRIRRSVSNGSRGLVKLALSLTEKDRDFEPQRQRLLTLYAQTLGQHARLYPGLNELLAACEARAIAWGIVTNKPRAYTEPLLEILGLRPPAGAVVCPDDVAHPKPHPQSLEVICDALDCSPGSGIYIGDHARDIEAGRRAGMYTIAAAYGYIEEDDAAERWGANAIAANSLDLQQMVLGQATEQSTGATRS